ncbi:hypothetical protein OAP07_03665 [Bacteroidia bacterium]|nr:hypothetical protein [Bacteroidia bacterium]MDC3407161.1 hypothetical protein [Bacteroidia bacterium]
MTVNKPQTIYRSIVTIHLIISILTTLIIGIVYTIRKNQPIPSDQNLLIFEFIIPLTVISSFIFSHYISKRKLGSIDKQMPLAEKLFVFKEVKIIQWVSLFGSIILATVSFLISAQQNLLLYAMMIGVMILYYRPVKNRVGEDLDLTSEELELLTSSNDNI